MKTKTSHAVDRGRRQHLKPSWKFSDQVSFDLSPGEYRVRELVHYVWDIVMSFDRNYPKRFKRAVLAEEVPGVRWLREDTHRTQVYELLRR